MAKTRKSHEPASRPDEPELGWVDAGGGYQLALDGGKLAARNERGRRLAAVPKELRGGEAAVRLEALRDWLDDHERACGAAVERWMLRSLTVPRAALEAAWEDDAWRRALENAVIAVLGPDGRLDRGRIGMLRAVDPRRGLGIVDLDGETAWLDAARVAVPHPVLIPELDAWRELVTQLGLAQGVPQLLRAAYPKPAVGKRAREIDAFEGGWFAMLIHAVGKARALGYKVRDGFAACRIWDATGVCEARYWLGADSPYADAYTGALSWVDERGRALAVAAVGPVAFSEGMRMAAAIYAARVVEQEEDPP